MVDISSKTYERNSIEKKVGCHGIMPLNKKQKKDNIKICKIL